MAGNPQRRAAHSTPRLKRMGVLDKAALIAEFTSGSDTRAEAAALRLAGEGPGNLAILKELAADPDPEVRWWATRALADINDPVVTLLLVAALHDPHPEVRKCGALALVEQPDERAVPALIQMLDAQDSLLARLAGNALVATGAAAVPELIEVMGAGSLLARLEAIRALCEIGDTRAIPVLFSAFEEDSALMEYWAAEGLEKMGVGTAFFEP
jgi:HEAT repeat protein